MWQGYYIEEEKKIEFKFKDFSCPIEGGVITGHTHDGRIVEGKIESNRKLVFTLKAADGEILYF
jgi:hypothetical protein